MAKYCGYCGAALPEHAKVCGMCGRPLVEPEGPAIPSNEGTAGQKSRENQRKSEQKKKPNERDSNHVGHAGNPHSRTASKVVCALLALVLVGAAAVSALKSFGDSDTPEMQTNASAGESEYEKQQSQPVNADISSDGKKPGAPGSAWDGTVRTEQQNLGQEYTMAYRGCCRKEDGGASGYTCFERMDGLSAPLGRVWADFNDDGIVDELEVLLESGEVPERERQKDGIPDGFGSLCLSFMVSLYDESGNCQNDFGFSQELEIGSLSHFAVQYAGNQIALIYSEDGGSRFENDQFYPVPEQIETHDDCLQVFTINPDKADMSDILMASRYIQYDRETDGIGTVTYDLWETEQDDASDMLYYGEPGKEEQDSCSTINQRLGQLGILLTLQPGSWQDRWSGGFRSTADDGAVLCNLSLTASPSKRIDGTTTGGDLTVRIGK